MFASAVIVFREVIEAALVVSIVMAATRGVRGRGFWISFGVLGGIIGAGLVAALTRFLANLFEGSGQEIVNASIALLAVALIGWHVVWMNTHGRALAKEMRSVGKSVADGNKHMSILALVVGLAVLREGSEVVLMLQGLWASSEGDMLLGAALGLGAGVVTGVCMYLGFVALPVARMFAVTNALLVLIAAGMAARGANFLAQAGLVSSLGSRLWDTSHWLSDQSTLGQFFAALIGYIARPNGIEVLFYMMTIGGIVIMMVVSRQLLRQEKAGVQKAHG